jgi:hypothetical protein
MSESDNEPIYDIFPQFCIIDFEFWCIGKERVYPSELGLGLFSFSRGMLRHCHHYIAKPTDVSDKDRQAMSYVANKLTGDMSDLAQKSEHESACIVSKALQRYDCKVYAKDPGNENRLFNQWRQVYNLPFPQVEDTFHLNVLIEKEFNVSTPQSLDEQIQLWRPYIKWRCDYHNKERTSYHCALQDTAMVGYYYLHRILELNAWSGDVYEPEWLSEIPPTASILSAMSSPREPTDEDFDFVEIPDIGRPLFIAQPLITDRWNDFSLQGYYETKDGKISVVPAEDLIMTVCSLGLVDIMNIIPISGYFKGKKFIPWKIKSSFVLFFDNAFYDGLKLYDIYPMIYPERQHLRHPVHGAGRVWSNGKPLLISEEGNTYDISSTIIDNVGPIEIFYPENPV